MDYLCLAVKKEATRSQTGSREQAQKRFFEKFGDCVKVKLEEEKKKLEKYIGGIKDDQTRMIFRLRFIHCMTWLQVAEAVGGRNTASSVRAICYRHLKSCSGANTRER